MACRSPVEALAWVITERPGDNWSRIVTLRQVQASLPDAEKDASPLAKVSGPVWGLVGNTRCEFSERLSRFPFTLGRLAASNPTYSQCSDSSRGMRTFIFGRSGRWALTLLCETSLDADKVVNCPLPYMAPHNFYSARPSGVLGPC